MVQKFSEIYQIRDCTFVYMYMYMHTVHVHCSIARTLLKMYVPQHLHVCHTVIWRRMLIFVIHVDKCIIICFICSQYPFQKPRPSLPAPPLPLLVPLLSPPPPLSLSPLSPTLPAHPRPWSICSLSYPDLKHHHPQELQRCIYVHVHDLASSTI